MAIMNLLPFIFVIGIASSIGIVPFSEGATITRGSPPLIEILVLNAARENVNFTCPEPDGFFAIPGECSGEYFVCLGGSVYIETCPANGIFDPVTVECVVESSATCKNFQCPPEDGFYPITPDACCQTYMVCAGNESYTKACPSNSIFNPSSLQCESPASCAGATTTAGPSTQPTTTPITTSITTSITTPTTTASTPEPTTAPTSEPTFTLSTTPTTPPINFNCPDINGFFAIPGTCGPDYYSCINNVPYLAKCPAPSTVFDPALLTCTSEDTAPCSTFECPAPGGFFPVSPNTCSPTYFICTNSIASITACPEGSIFDPILLYCDIPENAINCPNKLFSRIKFRD